MVQKNIAEMSNEFTTLIIKLFHRNFNIFTYVSFMLAIKLQLFSKRICKYVNATFSLENRKISKSSNKR